MRSKFGTEYLENKKFNIKGWKTVSDIEQVSYLLNNSRSLLVSGLIDESIFTFMEKQIEYLETFLNSIKSPDINRCSERVATGVWLCASQCSCWSTDDEEISLLVRMQDRIEKELESLEQ